MNKMNDRSKNIITIYECANLYFQKLMHIHNNDEGKDLQIQYSYNHWHMINMINIVLPNYIIQTISILITAYKQKR